MDNRLGIICESAVCAKRTARLLSPQAQEQNKGESRIFLGACDYFQWIHPWFQFSNITQNRTQF